MRVTEITIKRFLGIAEKRLECGQITTIAGANGSGKSSILEALKAGLGGGDLARLKMVGAEDDPEIVLVLDDGRYRVEREGKETVVKQRVGDTAAYETIRRPQSWLDSIFDPEMTNPLRFLAAHPNDRADILLEVLPLKFDRAALMAKVATAWPAGKELPVLDGHPLEVLGQVRAVLFDERTGVNRTLKDKDASAYELDKELPAKLPEDPAGELLRVATARDDLFRKITEKRAQAETAYAGAKADAQGAFDAAAATVQGDFKAAAAKLRAEEERQIAAIKERTTKAIDAEREKGETVLEAAEASLTKARADADQLRQEAFTIADALQPDLRALEESVARLGAQARDAAGLRGRKELADKFKREAEELKAVSAQLTQALETVDREKLALVKDLPIPGLEIQGRQILVDGIPFDQLNTARRIQIAVKVATLRARKQVLPVLFVDGAEALDAEQFGILKAELEKAGVQAFVARVADGELAIEARDGAVTEASAAPVLAAASGARRGRRTLHE